MRRAVLLTLLVLGLSLPLMAVGQTAASITEVGWWTRQPNASPASSGGFEIARTPDGDFSVAALRIRIEARALEKAILILSESDGVRADGAAIKVCPSSAAWSAANPGSMSAAPAAGCDRGKVLLMRNADTRRWTADVRLLLSDAFATSLVILSEVSQSPVVDPGFQVRFSNAQLEAEGGYEAPLARSATTSNDASDLLASTSSPTEELAAVPGEPAGAVIAESQEAAVSERLASGAAPRVLPRSAKEVPWGRLAFLAPLSALLGVAAALGRRLLDRSAETAE